MTTGAEFKTKLTTLIASIAETDSKIAEIAAFIATLKAGSISQAELDELAALVDVAQEKQSKVLTEVDALDEPAV